MSLMLVPMTTVPLSVNGCFVPGLRRLRCVSGSPLVTPLSRAAVVLDLGAHVEGGVGSGQHCVAGGGTAGG
jgi:hypothetical protein